MPEAELLDQPPPVTVSGATHTSDTRKNFAGKRSGPEA